MASKNKHAGKADGASGSSNVSAQNAKGQKHAKRGHL
jgi:hypothetical protein